MVSKRAVFFLLLIYVSVMVSVSTLHTVKSELVEDDSDITYDSLAAFLDCALLNVTARVTSTMPVGLHGKITTVQIMNFGDLTVRASTFDYNAIEWAEDGYILHNANVEWLETYYLAAKLVGTYDLGELVEYQQLIPKSSFKQGNDFNIRGKILSPIAMQTLNKLVALPSNSEATGFRDEVRDVYNINNIEAAGSNHIIAEPDLFEDPEYDTQLIPEFRILEEFLNETDDGTDLEEEALPTEQTAIIEGFDDTEEAVMDVLEVNLAANLTAMTNTTYTASDIEVVDYILDNSTQTTYIDEVMVETTIAEVQDSVLEQVAEEESKDKEEVIEVVRKDYTNLDAYLASKYTKKEIEDFKIRAISKKVTKGAKITTTKDPVRVLPPYPPYEEAKYVDEPIKNVEPKRSVSASKGFLKGLLSGFKIPPLDPNLPDPTKEYMPLPVKRTVPDKFGVPKLKDFVARAVEEVKDVVKTTDVEDNTPVENATIQAKISDDPFLFLTSIPYVGGILHQVAEKYGWLGLIALIVIPVLLVSGFIIYKKKRGNSEPEMETQTVSYYK